MNAMMVMAFVPTWVSNWLTPVWIVGVGALLGLVLLQLLWVVAQLLSRLPALGSLAQDRDRRRGVVVALAVVMTGLVIAAFVLPAWPRWQSLEADELFEKVTLSVLLAVPCGILAAFALVWFTSRRTLAEIPAAVREGALFPIFVTTVCFATFGVAGVLVVTQPRELIEALGRTPFVGSRQYEFPVPAPPPASDAVDPPQHKIDVSFRKQELRRLVFQSDESLTVDTEESGPIELDPAFEVASGETLTWIRAKELVDPFEQEQVRALYVRNHGGRDATLTLTVLTAPAHPEIWVVLITAFSVVGIFLFYLLQRAVLPRVTAVALSTFKSEVAQPLFLILMLLGAFALVLFIYIPYTTFGEDIKVLKDSGMTLIMVLCIIQAVWAAGTSIADEIEGRTALTVLSKPIGRRSFIVGKYLGIFWTVAVMFVVLGSILLLTVSYKVLFDTREGGFDYQGQTITEPTWQICHAEMIGVVPGLVLAFMEVAVLAAISVAISTRLPMLANFIISFSIYVLGNLTPLLVQSAIMNELFEPVVFVAQLIGTMLPVLDHFNVQAAVAAGVGVPYDYLGWALLYCLIYGVIALLLALVLFEDRDLA